MLDDNLQIDKLDAAVAEMIAGKYILSEKKIAGVLKAIASSERLVGIIGPCVKGFDFAAALGQAQIRDSYGRPSLRLPAERTRLIAFVFSLLMEVDAGKLNFIDFLSGYYGGSGDMHRAYDAFCTAAMIPFAQNIRALIEGVANVAPPSHAAAQAQRFFDDADDSLPYDAKELESLRETLTEITAEIGREHSLSLGERDEVLTITDALTNAVLSRNIRFIKILFIGAKNTAACSILSKRLLPLFDVLFKKLRSCGVI